MALGRKSTTKSRQPLAAHPAFAIILALWVAALFGLGMMVLPASLVEALVARTGISKLVPAAAPPLGSTARFLLAGGSAVAGFVLGFVTARILARFSSPSAVVEDDASEDEAFAAEDHVDEIEAEDEPFPFDVDEFVDEAEPEVIDDLEERQPAILTIEELDTAGLESAVAKDASRDWSFEDASHNPEDFRPDVGAWGDEAADQTFEEQFEPEFDEAQVAEPVAAPTNGLDTLRARRLDELSLAEMVERFGGALAEHREAIARDPKLHDEVQPVIAAALKALTGHQRAVRPGSARSAMTQSAMTDGNAALDMSTREQAEATEEALREALEKLQKMSGNF